MKTVNLFASYPPQYQPLARSLRVVAMLGLFWLAGVVESRAANILSWSGGGGTDTTWNNIANWGFAATPANGDTLIFSASQPNLLNTNNIANLTLNQIRFVGAGGGYDIRGNAFTLTNSIEATNTAGANTIENNITFATVTPNVDVTVSLTLGGVLSGSVGFTKNGPGTLVFNGPFSNVYGGTTTVNAGLLQMAKLGSPFATAIPGDLVVGNGTSTATVQNIFNLEIVDSANVTINNNGTWDLNNWGETVGNNLTLNGNATVSVGTAALTLIAPSTITVNGNSCAINGSGGVQLGAGPCGVNVIGTLKVFPSVQGAANITKTGPGNLFFYGANTYTGLTTVSQGWLWAENSLALGGTSSGTVVSNGATLVLQGGLSISNESLTLNGPGEPIWGALDGENFETNIWAGPIILNADSTIANYGGGTIRVIGPISGPGGLIESYGGVLSLEGTTANTYAGTTVVTTGTLNLGKIGGVGTVYAVPNSLVLSDGTTARLFQPWQLYSPNRSLALTTTLSPNSVFDLNGNSEWLAQVSINGGQIKADAGLLYLSGDITVSTNSTTNSKISGNMQLYPWLASTHNVITNIGHYFSPDIVISANISSSGTNTLIKDGPGEVDLNGTNNTFTGATIVNAGALWMDYTNGLGNTNLPATVNSGASLFLENNASVGLKPLVLNGPGSAFGALAAFGNSSWAGNVTLAGNTTVSAFSGGENLTLSGAISGSGALTIGQAGTVTLTGPADNSYAGTTTVGNGSTLLLNKLITDSGAIPGNLDVFGTLRLGNYEQISDPADVMLEGGSLFDFATFSESINTLRGSGGVTFGVNAYLVIGQNNGSGTYDGVMSGAGYAPGYTVGKFGTGTFTMNGNNTFTAGALRAWNGKLVVNGSQPQIPVIVNSGATFGGSGTVGNITANGVISPGNSPGILTSSNVTFSSSGNLTVELTGPNPGVGGYDQLNIRGANTLANATLTVIPAFTTPVGVGQTFTIINNDLADLNTGTFNGLAEGAGITANGFNFRLSYVGGSGNDVVLTLTNVPLAQAGASVTLGNGSGAIDPNECNYLSVVISNKLGTPITGISATLASDTPNVVITQPFATYPDVPGNGNGTNITPFQISTGTNFACGTTINLSLNVVTASQGSFSVPVVLSSGSPATLPSRYDNSTVTSIPDVGTLESTNTVSGFVGPLTKVVVAMYLTHTFDSDLTNISLIAPDGTTVLLTAANGGSGQNYGSNCSPDSSRVTFDDAAGASITSGVAPFAGTFRPQSPLSAFNGNGTPNGNWRLHIADGFGGSLGTLRCWSLFLYGTACAPGGGLCELCPNIVLMGATGPGSVVQTNYLTPNGTPSACGAPKACPGTTPGNIWPSDNYTFRNGPSDACITVTVEEDSPTVQMLATVYLGSYDPTNSDKCINYLADGGNVITGLTPRAFSFMVASNATFIVNVIASSALTTTPYKLTVTGGDCRPVLNVTPVGVQNVQLDWTTAAAGFGLESTNNLGGTGTNWPPVTNVPVVVNSRFMVTNSAASSNQFYRLHKQ